MTLMVGEPLQLSRSLLTRLAPTRWDKLILLSLIELLQLILLSTDIGTSVPSTFVSENKHFLRQIR
jgi:hypothetical protein